MRSRIAAMALAVGLVASACSGTVGGSADPQANEPAPAVPLTTFDGRATSLAEYAGRPVVVNFWASWCPACVVELSEAIRPVQERYGDRVAFVGIDLQDERVAALELIRKTGVEFDLVEDVDGAVYRAFGGLGMPFTVFVDASGAIVGRHDGPLEEAQLRERVQQLVEP